MTTHTTQKGFSAVEIVIGVVVIGLIAVLGYTAYNRFTNTPEAETVQTSTGSALAAPEIKQESDLKKATDVLDSAALEHDSSELDQELSNF